MALLIWLPLDGNLENLGLTDIEVTNNGAIIDNNGKIGKCYNFNGSSYINEKTYNWSTFNNLTFSLCCWYKEPSPVASGNSLIICIGTSSGWNNIRIGLLRRSSNGYPMFSVSNGTNAILYNCTMTTFPLDTWNHIAVTYNNGEIKMYLNGILNKTMTTTIIPVLNNSLHLGIGSASNGAEKLTGYLNDVRIYDHVLSIKEIKELAKGLVLHYKLNKPLHTNLLTMKPKSHDATAYNAYQLNLLENLLSGQTYTLLLWDVDVSHSAKTVAQTGVWVYWGGGSINLFNWAGSSYFTSGHANYLVKTFTVTAANASGSGAANAWLNIYNSVGNANGTRNLTIGAWKLEKGSVATPFDVGINDPAYAVAGYSANIEPDCSGYKRDGIITGTLTAATDTPRYRTSSYFNGSSYINAKDACRIKDAITVSCWVKPETTSGSPVSCIQSGGWGWQSKLTSYLGTNNNGSNAYVGSKSLSTATGIWMHIALTFDGTTVSNYLNGSLVSTATCPKREIYYNTNGALFIGGECNGNMNTPTSIYKGNISDVRVYCTALSADDIKALYEDAGYVDNQGNFHAYEYSEF